jgi:hypothetical protein
VFEPITEELSSLTNYMSGEFGLVVVIVLVGGGYLFWRKKDALPPLQT